VLNRFVLIRINITIEMNVEKKINIKRKMLSMNATYKHTIKIMPKEFRLRKSRIRKPLVNKGVKLTLLRRRSKLKTLN
jgi:hypothetical protein